MRPQSHTGRDAPRDYRAEGDGGGKGQPEPAVRYTLHFYEAARQGFFAGVDPLLAKLLGRQPLTARDALARPAA